MYGLMVQGFGLSLGYCRLINWGEAQGIVGGRGAYE